MKRTINAIIDAKGQITLEPPLHLDCSYRAILTVLGPIEGTTVAREMMVDSVPDKARKVSRFPSVAPLLAELEREAGDESDEGE